MRLSPADGRTKTDVLPERPRKDQDVNTDRVALIVDEPIPGHYYWILQRQDGAACRAVAAAEGPLPSHGLALMAGTTALQRRLSSRVLDRRPLPPVLDFEQPRIDFAPTALQ